MSKTTGKATETKVPIYMKYANTVSQNWLDPAAKLKPSDLSKPSIDIAAEDYPMIIEFNNMQDNTSYVHSVVDIDQPLFQPSPKIVMFEEYGPFTIVEKKIYFRNKDSVSNVFLYAAQYGLFADDDINQYFLGKQKNKDHET